MDTQSDGCFPSPASPGFDRRAARSYLPGLALAAFLATFGSIARAEIYSCRDKSGHTLTSDRAIPECADRPMRELKRSGVVRIIPAPLTAAQSQQQEADRRKQKLADDALREQQRQDRALLASYSTIESIEAARRRALEDTKEVIAGITQRIADLQKNRNANALLANQHKDEPSFRDMIEEADVEIGLERKSLANAEADLDRINDKYNASRRRFIELSAMDRPRVADR